MPLNNLEKVENKQTAQQTVQKNTSNEGNKYRSCIITKAQCAKVTYRCASPMMNIRIQCDLRPREFAPFRAHALTQLSASLLSCVSTSQAVCHKDVMMLNCTLLPWAIGQMSPDQTWARFAHHIREICLYNATQLLRYDKRLAFFAAFPFILLPGYAGFYAYRTVNPGNLRLE